MDLIIIFAFFSVLKYIRSSSVFFFFYRRFLRRSVSFPFITLHKRYIYLKIVNLFLLFNSIIFSSLFCNNNSCGGVPRVAEFFFFFLFCSFLFKCHKNTLPSVFQIFESYPSLQLTILLCFICVFSPYIWRLSYFSSIYFYDF